MSLLSEIQNSAVSSKSDLGEVLRMCKVLASRLESQPLADWLVWESDGYPEDAEVPAYRTWRASLKGHFSGPFGSGMRNAPIPQSALSDDLFETLTTIRCRQSVGSIETMLREPSSDVIEADASDVAPFIGGNVYVGQNCIQIWRCFSIGNFVEVLNAVRNRVLDFALALEKEAPSAGESAADGQPIGSERASQIFHTTVYGGSANFVGSAANSTVSFELSVGDVSELRALLLENRVPAEDIDALEVAIRDDGTPAEQGRFGKRVAAWIAMMVGRAAAGTWQIGTGTAGSLIAEALGQYYGWQK